ncbi:MAG: hypothetical protein WDN66_00105 [Candidatus Saccharibacteria bacterium]
MPLIKDIASEIIVTTFESSQDLPVTSCPPEDIYNELVAIGANSVSIEASNEQAYKKLLNSNPKELIITGSFYLIAQIRGRVGHD